MGKIEELQAELKKLQAEEENSRISNYQYLIGKCICRPDFFYDKIIKIDDVDDDDDDDPEINYTSISVCYEAKKYDDNEAPSIALDDWGSIPISSIDESIISDEEFNRIFEASVEILKKKILNQY